MKQNIKTPIFKTSAFLWDGNQKLKGTLELLETEICFRPIDFKGSHLNLHIPLESIEKVEEYLVFDLAKNGLKIQDKDGKIDLLVMDDVSKFKKILLEVLAK